MLSHNRCFIFSIIFFGYFLNILMSFNLYSRMLSNFCIFLKPLEIELPQMIA